MKNTVQIFLKGMAMGAADTVPGVSGGTIAFITGIYERLITAISHINLEAIKRLRQQGMAAAWDYIDGRFLLTLFAGIAFSVLILARGITWLIEHHPIFIWSFFFGLVAASVIVLARDVDKWQFSTYLSAIISAVVAFAITMSPSLAFEHNLFFLFFAGALAICAMILPGISGAFILLLIGAYETVLTAVHDFNLSIIATVGAGAICGLLTFSRVLKWLFAHYRAVTLAWLTGFIFGSLNKLWPWKAATDSLKGITHNVWPTQFAGEAHILWAILLAAVGFALIIAFEYFSNKPLPNPAPKASSNLSAK